MRRRSNHWKRLTAAAVMISVILTEQSIVYASGTGGGTEQPETAEEQLAEEKQILEGLSVPEAVPGEISGDQPVIPESGTENEEKLEDPPLQPGEADPAEQPVLDGAAGPALPEEAEGAEEVPSEQRTEAWYPARPGEALDAEHFLYEQEVIGSWEGEYRFEKSYGHQLSDTPAYDLYHALNACLDEAEETEELAMGEVVTEGDQLEGEDYETFYATYTKAAQNAFDAFWFDASDVETLDLENSRLLFSYTGVQTEDGPYRWSVRAAWELIWLEEPEESSEVPEEDAAAPGENAKALGENAKALKENAAALGENAAVPGENAEALEEDAAAPDENAEAPEENATAPGEDGITPETDRYSYLADAFRKVSELMEDTQAGENDTESEMDEEAYARSFRRLCLEADIACVLVKGTIDGQAGIWNAVQMEDEQWYIVDLPRGLFLTGLKVPEAGQEDGAGIVHVPYGDFSDSHQGLFVYPECSDKDYEKPEQLVETETQDPVPEEPEETDADMEAAVPAETEPEFVSEELQQSLETAMPETYSLAMVAEPETRAVQAPPEKALTPQVTVSAIKTQTYSGKALTPKVTVKDASTRKTLKVGKQYTVSYENNVNAGTGVVVIRGIPSGGYDGVLRVNFTINPQKITKARSKVVGKGFVYTGQPVVPGVDVTYNRMGLRAGVDYQITYMNNVAKGTAQIHLVGIGNYTGTKVLKYKIGMKKMKEVTVQLSSYSAVFTAANALPAVTVKYGSLTCQPGVDYTVSYPRTLRVGKNNITIKGRGNYTGSVKVVYTVSKASLGSAKVQLPYAWKYTGKSIKVLPSSVVVSGVGLRTNKDFTVKYLDANGRKSGTPKKPGNYKIVLTGKGNYQGTLTYNFCITGEQGVLDQNYNSPDGPPKPKPEPAPPDTSPGDKVPVEKDTYFGYYEGYKIFSKKGIQGVSNDTENLRVQHVLLNVDLAGLISTSARSGYVPYTYKGKTYYFSDLIALKNTVYYLHGWGSKDGSPNPYGTNHNRNVTFVLLMSWKDELSYLIHPSARRKGAAPYYALNMQEAAARDTFEALFRYMGEEFGEYKTRVSNWTLGNEVNSCKAWNYSGGMSLNECVANYAQAFQLLDKGVKRAATSSRLFLSLDHCWTASEAGHGGKEFLDRFAAYMNQTAPGVQWNVNYHPYSHPLTQAAFWGNTSSTSANVNTKYISMQNIQVLTDYLSNIERQYGKTGGSIRVIIGELGYTAVKGNTEQERLQAAALGYGYYIAMFNRRIDSYIIRAYVDDPAETSDKLYLGLRDRNHNEKTAYEVYQNLDTARSLEVMNTYLPEIGIESWESRIAGFDPAALTAREF